VELASRRGENMNKGTFGIAMAARLAVGLAMLGAIIAWDTVMRASDVLRGRR
jgi:hypothetical protein